MTNKTRLWAIAAASVLGVTLLSAQQTGALWRTEATLDGGTIHSGQLNLTVGSSTATSKDYALPLSGEGMAGGSFSQAPLTVKNSGNVPMHYKLANSAQSDATVPMTLTVTSVANEAACPATGAVTGTEIYSGSMIGALAPAAGWQPVMQPGASEVLCLRATMGANAPVNSATTVALSFAAESTR